MKYILSALIPLFILFISASAQSNHDKPFFDSYLHSNSFNYEEAYIKIDGKEATYADLLKLHDSSMLKVEVYTKKEAVKQFGKDVGKHGVILFTTKKYKVLNAVFTQEDSLDYYKKQGLEAYIMPDKHPTLDGDTTYKSWIHFLQKNLNAATPSEQGAPQGVYKLNVRFIVNEDGTISNVTVDEDAGYGTKEEIIRMMSKSPVWKPAIYKGKPIKFHQQEPIIFVVVQA